LKRNSLYTTHIKQLLILALLLSILGCTSKEEEQSAAQLKEKFKNIVNEYLYASRKDDNSAYMMTCANDDVNESEYQILNKWDKWGQSPR